MRVTFKWLSARLGNDASLRRWSWAGAGGRIAHQRVTDTRCVSYVLDKDSF